MEFREIFNIFKKKAVPVAATVAGAEASQPVAEAPNQTPAVVQEPQALVTSQGVEATFPTDSPVVTPSEASVITPNPEPSTPAPTLVPPIEQTPMPSPNETTSEPLPDTSNSSQPAETPKP